MRPIALVDYSHLIHRSLHSLVAVNPPQKGPDGKFITSTYIERVKSRILMILQKINQNHEELILCIDARPNWRVGLDSTYKGHRSEGRKKSLINFDEVFASLDQFLKQLEAFPLSIIEVPLAEADDIGGVLAEYFTLNKQNATLITSDHDWSQSISEYVTQWCPIKKKEIVLQEHEKGYTYLKCLDKDVLNFSIIHAIQGDKGDGVNSLTGGTQFTQVFQDHLDSLRPGITPLKFANLTQAQKDILTRNFSTFKRISSGKNKGKLKEPNELDLYKTVPLSGPLQVKKLLVPGALDLVLQNEHYKQNFLMNFTKVSFTMIPEDIKNNVILAFNNREKTFNKKIMNETIALLPGTNKHVFNNISSVHYVNIAQKESTFDFSGF